MGKYDENSLETHSIRDHESPTRHGKLVHSVPVRIDNPGSISGQGKYNRSAPIRIHGHHHHPESISGQSNYPDSISGQGNYPGSMSGQDNYPDSVLYSGQSKHNLYTLVSTVHVHYHHPGSISGQGNYVKHPYHFSRGSRDALEEFMAQNGYNYADIWKVKYNVKPDTYTVSFLDRTQVQREQDLSKPTSSATGAAAKRLDGHWVPLVSLLNTRRLEPCSG
ncbi:hypothetical protein GGR54DRAFT_479194 [Hypoxylon sp. NC1633]|nr:hypothetical protein GGR54DRAFT_479194 [Hypoxylon sp. NC1633]